MASALLAAFRITSEELALIRAIHTRRGAEPRLDLAGLSAISRVVVLARALQLRIPALDLLLRLTPPEADPFRPGDPAATRRFVEIVREVQASDFTPERLAYLFRHESEPRRDPGPVPAQVEAVLANIRRGLADAFSETSRPADVSGEVLRQKLAMLLDPALLDPALEALDPRTPLTPQKRREFFDRHLARIFADPAAAAVELFGAPATGLVSAAPAMAASADAGASPQSRRAARRGRSTARDACGSCTGDDIGTDTSANGRSTGTGNDRCTHGTSTRRTLEGQHQPRPRATCCRNSGRVSCAAPSSRRSSDTLGLSVPSTARCSNWSCARGSGRTSRCCATSWRSLGTGLTGAYYANPDLSGEPVVTRTDPEIAFAWSGAAPADGVPGRDFSARWTGRLLAKSKAPHTFYIETDGAVRLTLAVNDQERVLIDQPSAGRTVEHASEPIALDPSQLAAIRLEYRNQGGPATLALQFGTGPVAKQPIPTTNLYPADGLSSFAPVEQSYRRLHKAALIITGFGMTDAQLEWLTGSPPFLDLDTLADALRVRTPTAWRLLRRWRQLAAPVRAAKEAAAHRTPISSTCSARGRWRRRSIGWCSPPAGSEAAVEAFLGPDGLAIDSVAALGPAAGSRRTNPLMLRLARAIDVQRRVGVAPATLYAWANGVPDADGAATIVQAVKARYDETRWLEVARGAQRSAASRAPRRAGRVPAPAHARSRGHEPEPVVRVLPDRRRHEPLHAHVAHPPGHRRRADVLPTLLDEPRAEGAAARHRRSRLEVAEELPGLGSRTARCSCTRRTGSSRSCATTSRRCSRRSSRAILQQEIKNDNVEAAFADYLEGLDEIARLDVRGVWFEERQTHRMVARRGAHARLRIPEAPRSEWDTARTTSSRAPSTRRTSGTTAGSRAAATGRRGKRSTRTSRANISCRSCSTGACTCSGRCSAR